MEVRADEDGSGGAIIKYYYGGALSAVRPLSWKERRRLHEDTKTEIVDRGKKEGGGGNQENLVLQQRIMISRRGGERGRRRRRGGRGYTCTTGNIASPSVGEKPVAACPCVAGGT